MLAYAEAMMLHKIIDIDNAIVEINKNWDSLLFLVAL